MHTEAEGRAELLLSASWITLFDPAATDVLVFAFVFLPREMQMLPAVATATACSSEDHSSTVFRLLQGLGIVAGGTLGAMAVADIARADEAEHGLHAPSYPWPHNGIFSGYDHAS